MTNASGNGDAMTTLDGSARADVRTEPRKVEGRGPLLDRAAAELKRVAIDGVAGQAELMTAARLLRAAALERRLRAPRTASLALLVSDAMTFTPSSVIAQSREPLVSALRWLLEPFVPEEAEESVFDAFLEAGWDVTGSFDAERYAHIEGIGI